MLVSGKVTCNFFLGSRIRPVVAAWDRDPCDPGISRAGFFVWSTGCIGAMSLEYNTLKSQMFRDLARQLHHRPSVRQFLEVANRCQPAPW